MKSTIQLFMFLAVIGLTITSCGKETVVEKVCTDLAETLVGIWESDQLGSGTFEFKADGTLVDDNFLLLSIAPNPAPLIAKKWTATDNTMLSLSAFIAITSGISSLNEKLEVDSFDCDEITINQSGELIKFRRT